MAERFTQFTMQLSRLSKLIQKLKTDGMGGFGLKAVDTLCLYQLDGAGELSFAQVAERCDTDAALVSRTLSALVKNGMVEKVGAPGKYRARYRLTEPGRQRTAEIRAMIQKVQERADQGISEEDLAVFYRVLQQLTGNFEKMAEEGPLFFDELSSGKREHQEETV